VTAVRAFAERGTMPEPGDPVAVWSEFAGTWCRGFEVAHIVERGGEPVSYRLRRLSDGALLPADVNMDDVVVDRHPAFGRTR
jgi:hypothetical protein